MFHTKIVESKNNKLLIIYEADFIYTSSPL